MPIASPERRHLVGKGLSRIRPLLDLVASVARRTVVRRTCFVAVVGSFGKTTTTRALSLGLTGNISRFSQNNTGPWNAIAVLGTRPGARFSVVEVGISKLGDMAPRARLLRPDVVVVTSIGSEHQTSFGTLEATRSEKALMLEALDDSGVAVLNGDDANVMWMRSRTNARVITFGSGPDNDVRATRIMLDWPHGTRFVLSCNDVERDVRTRLLGRRTIHAVLATVAVAVAREVPLEPVLQRLENLEPMRARLQYVPLDNGVHLIRDDEKSTLETIETALELLAEIPADRKICVLGQVSEPPGPQGQIYPRVGEQLAAAATHAVLIADREGARRYNVGLKRAGASTEIIYRGKDFREATARLQEALRPGDVVLVKGRDTQRLARVSLALAGRTVRCAAAVCQIRLTDCEFCGRLETGWPGNPTRVP